MLAAASMADVLVIKEIEDKALTLGIDLSTVDLDSIHLPPGGDYGIFIDDEEVYKEENLGFDTGFGNIIVVDNTPVVTKEKFTKLEGVIRKIFSQIGVIKDDGFWMPVDPATEKTVGYCFIEFNTPREAELAKERSQRDIGLSLFMVITLSLILVSILCGLLSTLAVS